MRMATTSGAAFQARRYDFVQGPCDQSVRESGDDAPGHALPRGGLVEVVKEVHREVVASAGAGRGAAVVGPAPEARVERTGREVLGVLEAQVVAMPAAELRHRAEVRVRGIRRDLLRGRVVLDDDE